jgi:hypothetical protein
MMEKIAFDRSGIYDTFLQLMFTLEDWLMASMVVVAN